MAALQAEAAELERILKLEQDASDEKVERKVSEADEAVRLAQLQRDSMRADVVQAQEHFENEERCVMPLQPVMTLSALLPLSLSLSLSLSLFAFVLVSPYCIHSL